MVLPLIRAMAAGSDAERALIRGAIESGGLNHLADIVATIESTGALEYTRARAQQAADAAIAAIGELPSSAYRDALIAIAEFSVSRRF